MLKIKLAISCMWVSVIFECAFVSIENTKARPDVSTPKARLIPSEKFYFNSFVDCNMAEAWIGDTFRIFPGKYGEDPLWGYARDLKYADGRDAHEAFTRQHEDFKEPKMPANAAPGTPGL